MKVIYWNIRGLGNSKTQALLANYCRIHKPSWVAIAEPMIDFSSIPVLFWKSLGLQLVFTNTKTPLPNLWLLSKIDYSVTYSIKFCSAQCIIIESLIGSNPFVMGFIYAHVRYLARRSLWNDLLSFQHYPFDYGGL